MVSAKTQMRMMSTRLTGFCGEAAICGARGSRAIESPMATRMHASRVHYKMLARQPEARPRSTVSGTPRGLLRSAFQQHDRGVVVTAAAFGEGV